MRVGQFVRTRVAPQVASKGAWQLHFAALASGLAAETAVICLAKSDVACATFNKLAPLLNSIIGNFLLIAMFLILARVVAELALRRPTQALIAGAIIIIEAATLATMAWVAWDATFLHCLSRGTFSGCDLGCAH